VRFAGGSMFLLGMLIMAYNVWKTSQMPAATVEQSS
jgi:cbb3-type cytochrome oxidase subunit 1